MDCELAREQLEAARPDVPERDDEALRSAYEHLDECPACAEVLAFRRLFDRRMRAVVRDVPVPADLRSRLSIAVAALDAPVRPAAADASVAPLPPDRRAARRAFLLATSAAGLLAAAGATWFVTNRPPAPLMAASVLDWWQQQLSQSCGFQLESLPEFNGRFEPTVADGRWQSRLIGPPRGADIDQDGQVDAAVFAIREGFLVVLPPGRVSDPPSATSAATAPRSYAPAPHVAWTQGGSMHLCFAPGASSTQFERLLRSVNRAA